VFALYDQVLLEYASTKAEYGLLDFDDLIERFLALLGDPQVRARSRVIPVPDDRRISGYRRKPIRAREDVDGEF